ncbi:MAG: heme-binding protein [Roseibium sp.]|uniref:GlcG/HbpS family heme-binding protein n=1 Tax=Roseibium sp. TaxID=1936156 RepID=UPI002620EA59|nr:heme-binding protein [Roseibium sp.]MCV0427162.1 heme-binding protein [Roseibium sp.]
MRLQVSLPLAEANLIADEALRLGREEELLPLTVVILDAGGKLVVSKCEDGSGIMRFDVAYGKAWGALGMGISSRLIRDRLSSRPTFQSALATASHGRLIPVPGGVLVRNADNITIGAVGISGDTSDKDEYCAIEAIRISGLLSEPAEPAPDWRASSLSDHYPD